MQSKAAHVACFCFSGREVAFVVAVTALAMLLRGEPSPAGPFDWICFVVTGGTSNQTMPLGSDDAGFMVRCIIWLFQLAPMPLVKLGHVEPLG